MRFRQFSMLHCIMSDGEPYTAATTRIINGIKVVKYQAYGYRVSRTPFLARPPSLAIKGIKKGTASVKAMLRTGRADGNGSEYRMASAQETLGLVRKHVAYQTRRDIPRKDDGSCCDLRKTECW